eukprot:g3342.t2
MVDCEKMGAVGALSRQLQAISGSGWTNVQTPVRQGFEAVEATAHGLAEQLAASREDVRRLEARLVGMEDMLSRRLDSNARATREEVDVLRSELDSVPRLVDVQTTSDEACRGLELEVTRKILALEQSLSEVREENRKAVESVRQDVAAKAGLSDLEAFCPRGETATRADLQDLESRVSRKAGQESVDTSLATKVSWQDFERFLREKADASALAEVEASCATVAALERVELGLARTVGMEEVRAFVETQTGDIQSAFPAVERLLVARAREEREAAERAPASSVTRGELRGLIQASLRELRDGEDDRELYSSPASAAQVQAAISTAREGILRTVEALLARARSAHHEEMLTQEKRLRLDLDESVGRVRARTEGLCKSLEQAKGELVSLLNSKAYKADMSLLLQGKADSKDLDSVLALVRSKVDESDYRATSARTLHSMTAFSGELGGLRGDLRVDLDRLSSRLLAKADADDLQSLKNTLAGTSAAAAEAAATASAASAAVAEAAEAASSRRPEQPVERATASTTGTFEDDDQALPSPRRTAQNGGGGVTSGRSSGGGGADRCPAQPPGGSGAMYYGARASREERAATAPTNRGLSREETRLLIRAELKRAAISEKITREEASVQAEECASRALSSASRATEAVNLRVRALGEKLEATTVAVSQPHVEQLFAAQANLELRMARSLSLGRWLWRGNNFSELWATAKVGVGLGLGLEAGGHGGGGNDGLGESSVPRGGSQDGSSRGIRVPWETEAANSSPERLKWIPGGTSVIAVVPGLYLVSCGFFSQQPFVATVYLNQDPVYSVPSPERETLPGAGVAPHGSKEGEKPDDSSHGRYTYNHPAGEVLATSAREYLALPAGGEISVKFDIRWRDDRRHQEPLSRAEKRPTDDGARCDSLNDAGATVGAAGGLGSAVDGRCGQTARRLGVLPRPQGFLELHKL